MDNTLIVFASNHGTVEKCARELFRRIEGKVDICNLNRRNYLPDLSGYEAIIVGGSIHNGKIQDEISSFCNDNLELLASKRLGLFINCLYSGEKAQQQLDDAFPDVLNRRAVVRDYFGGEVDKLKLSFWERVVTSRMIREGELVVAISKERIERFAKIISSVNEPKN
ncbi:flavodoxin domain-containing protein [Proteiniphilum sp.]|uniref:flavodoxin domain-containing protein n=1 Tax=Proteiniphilum sp. TaxID=1926877 RepID=UPI002B21DA45|nr:flavodoxin domain-containing protein [Proteiniphilum sp.]MEA4916648.1 flavodoxin domain-containing protein [Proteiniphilum sp.]